MVTLVFLWENLSEPQFYKNLTRKTAFFEGRSWFKFSNLGLALGTNLKFYTSVAKGLKLKFRKFWRLSYRRKTGRGPFCTPFRPILNRVNRESCDRFVVLVERELQKSPIWLINHWKKLREFVLFIKLFLITKMKILKNTLELITRHWIRPCLHNTFYGLEAYGVPSKK